MFSHVTQRSVTLAARTIKCLLIYPNPESALNEEAGRLLQTAYEEYHQRARMMTEVHAQPRAPPKEGQENMAAGPQAKKHAGEYRGNKPAKPKTAAANKSLRRILKRL
ncbi:UBE2S [Cordylochernes scorpioides]|uniref:UBE2S n=1 Tax=Cordylochernes scorpioides TaxID=51811 RepID=A0ABY6LF22_9ARAC|nr:UBE2S [Cordylochernes scorpioides]